MDRENKDNNSNTNKNKDKNQKQCAGLVIQNNPFSDQTGNGKTVASMLSEWDREHLAQIYVSDLEPDFSICRHYFKMSDRDALCSFLSGRAFGIPSDGNTAAGIPCMADDRKNGTRRETSGRRKLENGLIQSLENCVKESSFAAVVRDWIWRGSHWKNRRLCDWLDKIRPDFVYLIAGNMSVFYDMALFICRRYHIPLYIQIGDDYFIYRSGLSPWKNIHRIRMSGCLEKAIAQSVCVFAICQKLAWIFKKKYGGRYFVCMNCVEMKKDRIRNCSMRTGRPLRLVYAGNLGINRYKVLHLIGQALLELGQEEGIHARLEIYSSYLPEKRVRKKLELAPVMTFCGSRYGEELEQVKQDADILVHVEAFERRYRQLTYTAMSTKISEYLAAGRVILAVGPEEAASIGFLLRHDVAMVVSEYEKQAVKAQIRSYYRHPETYADMRRRAVRLAGEKFSKRKNARRIYKIISTAGEKSW